MSYLSLTLRTLILRTNRAWPASASMNKLNLSYFRSTSILARGAFICQVIKLGFYPVITRIFPPEAYGRYALLTSFVSLAAVGATLRYDMAIVSAETEVDAY